MPEVRKLSCGGRFLSYTLTRKRVKNLNLRLRRDGSVAVSAPAGVPVSRIDTFVLSKASMILETQARLLAQASETALSGNDDSGSRYPYLGGFLTLEIHAGTRNSAALQGSQLQVFLKDPENTDQRARQVEKALNDLCRKVFLSALTDVYPPFASLGVPMPELKIRKMKTRWGSCFYTQGRITLNRALLGAPLPCIRYVAAHELCHFLVPNHSPAFYALLGSVCPDWKRCREDLNSKASIYL